MEIGFVKVKTSSKWFVWTEVQIHKFYKRIFSLDISKTILRRGWQANIIQQSNTSKLSIITHTKVKTDKFGCESSICAFEGGPYAIKLSPFEDPSKRNLINDQAWAFQELHNRVIKWKMTPIWKKSRTVYEKVQQGPYQSAGLALLWDNARSHKRLESLAPPLSFLLGN